MVKKTVKIKNKSEKIKTYSKDNLEKKLFVNFFDTTKYKAIIYNKNGEQIDIVNLKRTDETFTYKDNSFIINWDHKHFMKRKDFFNNFKYFKYYLDDPQPIDINGLQKPDLDTKTFNQLFHTKVTKDLNNVNNSLAQLLTPKNILIGLGVIAIIYYLSSGGTLI